MSYYFCPLLHVRLLYANKYTYIHTNGYHPLVVTGQGLQCAQRGWAEPRSARCYAGIVIIDDALLWTTGRAAAGLSERTSLPLVAWSPGILALQRVRVQLTARAESTDVTEDSHASVDY